MQQLRSGRGLRRVLSVLLAATIGVWLSAAPTASAHPLGNFSVNRYSRLIVSPEEVRLVYVLDMAEIPTFQIRPNIDQNGDGALSSAEQAAFAQTEAALIAAQLTLTVDGAPAALATTQRTLTFPQGQGGLPTLRLRLAFSAPLVVGSRFALSYADNNYADRLGWREVVAQGATGVKLTRSTVPAQDVSQELTVYPTDMLSSPLAVSAAEMEGALTGVEMGGNSAETAPVAVPVADRFNTDRFANLINRQEWTPLTLALTAITAFGLGALHALTPGHGKTIVGAYLVGSRGTPKHALLLGLTTTVTHTAGVFAFGLLVLFASRWFMPGQILPWFGVASGLLVAVIGLAMLLAAWQRRRPQTLQTTDPGYHTHFGVAHSHAPAESQRLGWRSLLALGISGGLDPCPTALVLLLAAIALQQVGLGLLLILIFSLGLASVLTGIGLVMVTAGRWLEGSAGAKFGRIMPILPILSGAFILLAGVLITVRAVIGASI